LAEVPTRPELERFSFLDDDDRDLIALRRSEGHRLGMAVQIGTVRHIGRFLGDDPPAVPWEVVEYLAGQLGIEDTSGVKHVVGHPLVGMSTRTDTGHRRLVARR
jgi:hypothetical protein